MYRLTCVIISFLLLSCGASKVGTVVESENSKFIKEAKKLRFELIEKKLTDEGLYIKIKVSNISSTDYSIIPSRIGYYNQDRFLAKVILENGETIFPFGFGNKNLIGDIFKAESIVFMDLYFKESTLNNPNIKPKSIIIYFQGSKNEKQETRIKILETNWSE
ncbi:MAG: hypothetical protein ACK5MD_04990 [Flavobacteriales bacterium]